MMPHIRLPLSRADKVLSTFLVGALLVACAGLYIYMRFFLPASARVDGMKSITRNGFTATFLDCPKCEMCARFALDGKTATINRSRLGECEGIVDRVFATLADAARSPAPFWFSGNSSAKSWREMRGGVAPTVVRDDAEVEILSHIVRLGGEVAIFNKTDVPREIVLPFSSIGLRGRIEILDLTERAIPPDATGTLRTVVAPHAARILRLKGERCADAQEGK